jgi:predicted acylesterase/phospholipase RssA
LKLEDFKKVCFRPHWNPLEGTIDVRRLEALLETVAAEHTPSIPLTVLATDLFRLRLKAFTTPGLTWRHLAASCALFGLFPQYRIDGRRYSDGGLLCGLPIRPAAQMGARRIVAINCLPGMPLPIRAALRLMRCLTGGAPKQSSPGVKIEVTMVAPSAPLGSLKDAACWDRGRAERWIEAGRRDAEAVLDC